MGVVFGFGASVGGAIGMEDGHVTLSVDITIGAGVGFHLSPSIDLDLSETIEAVGDFFAWLSGG
ncbi:MAG: hypothetical protein LBU07_05515 [Coriobacteriales bacterium]|nr:hypothetical protein [Coriobacteriales bacterium]